jgi:hypothetical protein
MQIVPRKKEPYVAIVYLQEFTIQNGDTSTTNYDAVVAALNLQDAPDGLLIHTAGFDHDAGVFRILDVWETREQGEKFINDRLNPITEPMGEAAAKSGDTTFAPPSRETWYELHDSVTG